MIGQDGDWNGHFWVEGVLDCGERVIADLTADQFGHASVVVTDILDVRYRRNVLATYKPLVLAERTWGNRLFGEWLRMYGSAFLCPDAQYAA